ncbi:unnamed protein product, partial [Ectocarpus sp. 12 AP-2014]
GRTGGSKRVRQENSLETHCGHYRGRKRRPGGCDRGRRQPCPDTRKRRPKFQRARRVHHVESILMSDSPLQHMRRIFGNVEGINEAELRRQFGELVCCAGVVSL